MSKQETTDEDWLYTFCLDWQMEIVSHYELKLEFISKRIDFKAFKEVATKRRWFVTSMQELAE